MYVKTTCCESVNNAQGETLHQNVTLKSDRFMYCNALNASTCFNEVCLDHELSWPILAYLKNRCTKHRLVCTHFDAFSKLITNMGIILNNSDLFIFFFFWTFSETAPDSWCKELPHSSSEQSDSRFLPSNVIGSHSRFKGSHSQQVLTHNLCKVFRAYYIGNTLLSTYRLIRFKEVFWVFA